MLLCCHNLMFSTSYSRAASSATQRPRKAFESGGQTMASAERQPITGIWRRSLQRSPEAELVVRGSGGKAP